MKRMHKGRGSKKKGMSHKGGVMTTMENPFNKMGRGRKRGRKRSR